MGQACAGDGVLSRATCFCHQARLGHGPKDRAPRGSTRRGEPLDCVVRESLSQKVALQLPLLNDDKEAAE